LKCWGGNFGGLLGADPARIGTEVGAPIVPPLTPFRDVSLSPYHACGIRRSADVVECWGSNAGAELGTLDAVEPGHPVATPVPGVVQVATSAYATCVRTNAGQVLCWGAGVAGGTAATRAEPAPVGIEGATSLLSGAWGFCATLADETARCWGPYLTPAPTPLEDGRVHGLVSMGLGGSVMADLHFCYVHSEGLTCTGRNDNGQLGAGDFHEHPQRVVVSLPSRPVRVATGLRHTCAATESGELYCWGANDLGQLGLGPDVGKVAGSFRSVESPTKVPGLEGVLEVTASNGTTCVRLRTGQVQCFGANESGNAGDATFLKRMTPVNVVGLP
jgi:alpha-tubulin suppressor-like RCC1 family protein